MLNKQMRLKLASMLRLYKQVATDNGLLIVEAEEFTPGEEVFIQTENGEIIPCNDGTYSDGTNEYVIVDGKLAEIREEKVEPAEEKPAEEKPAEDSEEVKTLKQELNDVKEENEALKAKVEELEAKIKEYEEKANETEASAEDAEKFANEKKDKYAKVMTRMSYLKK